MTTHNKHIHYDYYNTLAIRASPTKFQFSGKPNEPNVVFTNGPTTTHYTSKEISIVGSTLIIENEPITNYGKNLFIHFPLVSDPSVSYNAIDQMLGSKVGESLEILLAPILGQDTDCIYNAENIAVFPTPIRIRSSLTKDTVIEGAKCNDTNKLKADIDKLSKLIGAMRADTDSLLTIHKEGFQKGATSASTRTAGSSRGQIANIQSISDQVGDEAIKNAIKNAFAGAGGAGGATLECTPLNDKGVKQKGQYLAVPMNTNETATIFSIGLAYVIVIIMSTGFSAFTLLRVIQSKDSYKDHAKMISLGFMFFTVVIGLICIIAGGVKKDNAVISIGGSMILIGLGSGYYIYNKFKSEVITPTT